MAVSTRARLRKFWFQVHLWLGVGLFAALIPICVTGSYEVWHEEIDRLVNARRYDTTVGEARTPSTYAASAQAAFGARATVNVLRLPARPGDPVVVTGLIHQPGRIAGRRPPVLTAWLDPATGRVLDVADTGKALRQTIHRIHGSLLIPEVGRKVVGWLGWALSVSALSGLWLWWPRGAFARGFRWRRSPSTLLNLHYLTGFWIALPLAVLALSGALISFPQTTRAVLAPVAPVSPQPARGGRGGGKPLTGTALGVDAAVDAARAALPGAEARTVNWPTRGERPAWRIDLSAGGQTRSVKVDDAGGRASIEPVRAVPAGDAALRWNRRIHDGTDMALIWRVIITLAGLLPALLGVTGAIIWARRQYRKAQVRGRRPAPGLRPG